MPAAIDTLNIYSRLKSTGLSEESAKEIAGVFRQTVDENLANKIDLEQVRSELKKDIEQLRTEVKKDIEQLRSELKKDIELLRSDLQKEIAESKAGIIRWVAGMLVAQAVLIAALVKLL